MRHSRAVAVLLLLGVLRTALSYKEFSLSRSALTGLASECSSSPHSPRVYPEICYWKDVNYHLPLLIDDTAYYVALDLTAPLSWLKTPDCHNNCTIIRNQDKHAVEQEFRDVKTRFRFFGRGQGEAQQETAIVGSSDLVAGQLRTVESAEFYAKDSRSAGRLGWLVGQSLFLTPQRDSIALTNVSLLQASRLSQGVDALTDGAISFRPNPDNSTLLAQLFANSETPQRIVTIFLHPLSKTGTVSIGDLSLKNTRSKAQITWVPRQKETNDTVSLRLSGLALRAARDTHTPETTLNAAKDIVLSTSSSFIFLPEDSLRWLATTLRQRTNASCAISPDTKTFRCEWRRLEEKRQALMQVLTFNLPLNASFAIPATTLTLVSDALFIEFAIRSSPSGRVILGEPFFEEYVAFIDYAADRVGFAPAFFHAGDKFTAILVYFLRALLFAAILLFLAYLCYNPCRNARKAVENKLARIKKRFAKKGSDSFDQLGENQEFF